MARTKSEAMKKAKDIVVPFFVEPDCAAWNFNNLIPLYNVIPGSFLKMTQPDSRN